MKTSIASLLLLAAIVVPARAEDSKVASPGGVTLRAPELAVTAPPTRVVIPREKLEGRQGGPAPLVIPEDASTELRAYLEHVHALAERGSSRGAEVGGHSMIGVQPGGLGDVPKLQGVIDDAAFARLTRWDEQGALVVKVVPGGPAEAAGLLPGDVIIQFAGLWIDSSTMLVRTASRAVVGQEYEVQYVRGGEVERTWVMPADRRELEKR